MSGEASGKLRALVVEDEWAARNYLVELLEASGLAHVAGAVPSADEARQVVFGEPRLPLDVVFIDIRLSGGRNDGLDLARELAGMPKAPLLVLATAFKAHALEAFELGVTDYLLKPFTEERVEQCLRRLRSRRPLTEPSAPVRIVARRDKSLVFFTPEEVWAFEAAERMTRVHTAHGMFDLDLSLSAIEASFGKALARVHRNWLVNVAHIKELERDGTDTRVFVGERLEPHGRGIHVPVARERAQQLRDTLLASATGVRRGT